MNRKSQGCKNGKARRRKVLHPGIMNDARVLGVHRVHLYEVLVGKRVSHSLKRRYQALQDSKKRIENIPTQEEAK